MAEFSGIRATARSGAARRLGRAAVAAALALAPVGAGPARAAGGHGAEAPAAAPVPPPPPKAPKPAPPPLPKLEKVESHPRPPKMPADPATGLALAGLDAVSYFVDGAPRPGRPEFELDWRGATWRFANEGNYLAFKDAPEVYAPRFGGYCAFQMARGYATEASPHQYLIVGDRLYLFASGAHRVAFRQNPDKEIAEAEAAWPRIAAGLP